MNYILIPTFHDDWKKNFQHTKFKLLKALIKKKIIQKVRERNTIDRVQSSGVDRQFESKAAQSNRNAVLVTCDT